jgi:arylsulfatase
MRFLFISILLWSLNQSVLAQDQPNIIFMLADNLGYGDLGCYGGGIIRGAPTPNIDQLAREGKRFTNFNVEPECTPSRSALMTGRYAVRSGTTRAVPIQGMPQGLAPWEVTIAEILKEKGYQTAIYGKWHIGASEGRYPTNQGFDEWWGITNSTDVVSWPTRVGFDKKMLKQFYVYEGVSGEKVKPAMPYDLKARPIMDETIQNKSIAYINERAKDKKPFFLYIPWIAVHHPPIPHPDFEGKSGNGQYADLTMEHDYRVGQVMKAVETAGLSKNTIIIYASDNGPDRAYYPNMGDSGPFRGYLGSVHEGSIRTPMIMKWDGKIEKGQVSNDIVSITDFLPTLSALVGGNTPKDRAIDGVNQKDLFFGSGKSKRDGILFFHDETFIAAKWRQFKLYFKGEGAMQEERDYKELWAPQVYNIMSDPKELNDIGLKNLWIVGPALKQLIPFYASVKQYGLVQSGASKPSPGEITIPFLKSSLLNEMFQKKMQQHKAAIQKKKKAEKIEK